MREISEIYGQMLEVFEQKTGFAMEDTADLAVRLYAAAAQVQAAYVYCDWVLRQAFVQTAEAEFLEAHAAQRGLERKKGVCANGVLRFRVEQPRGQDVVIEAGTVCTTAGLVRFVTTEEGTIESGSLYTDIPAVAEQVGAAGNVTAQAICNMPKAPVGVVGVTNPAAFTGGCDAEDDEQLRKRVADSFTRLPNGANAAFYEQRALSHDGVEAVTVLPRMNGIGTVGVVVSAAKGTDEQALLNEIHADLQSVREIAVDVSVLPPTARHVDVEVQIVPKRNVSAEEAAAAVETAVRGFFTGKLLGGSVYRAALGNAVYDTGMVENYVLIEPQADIYGQTAVLPKLHTLKVTEAEA